MPEKIEKKDVLEMHDRTKPRMQKIAMEALQDLFHRVPFGEKIKFSDGREGVITPFIEPNIDPDRVDHLGNVPYAGIDIQLEDGHLEFILFQGGWGGDVIPKGNQ